MPGLYQPRRTQARYPGTCWTCRKPIAKGESIEYEPAAFVDPNTGKTRSIVWHAETCLAPTPQQRRTRPDDRDDDPQHDTTHAQPSTPSTNGHAAPRVDPRDNIAADVDDEERDEEEDEGAEDEQEHSAQPEDDDARALADALRRLTQRKQPAQIDREEVRHLADERIDARVRPQLAELVDAVHRLDLIGRKVGKLAQPQALDLAPVKQAADAAAYDGTRRAIEEAQKRGEDTSTLDVPPPVPTLDPLYEQNTKAGSAIRYCLETDRHALVSGPSGSGKTYPVRMECASLGRPVVELSAGDGIGYSHLIGTVTLEHSRGGSRDTAALLHEIENAPHGETLVDRRMRIERILRDFKASGGIVTGWRDGAVLRAMRHGAVLLLDELDQLPRPLLALLYGILEPGRLAELYVPEIGATVRAKPGFQVMGTGNTIRDTSGQYSGERPSVALLNRFAQVPADYLSATQETKILERVGLAPQHAKALAAVLTALRLEFAQGAITTAPSTRTGVQVAQALLGKKPDGTPGGARITWSAALTLYVTGALPDEQAARARLKSKAALATHGVTNPDAGV